MNRIKGILYAAVSSATFGLAPFFSISLLAIGYSSFEVLTYRWGVATVVLLVFAFLTKCDFHIGYKDFKTMDALQLASACIQGCDLFLTNDKQLKQFKEINCITVEEW